MRTSVESQDALCSIHNATSPSQTTGSLSAVVSGGTPPYKYHNIDASKNNKKSIKS